MTAAEPATRPTEQPLDKGLKSGALGLVSSVVIGVASTAPAYSLAATLGFVVAAVGLQVAGVVAVLAFVPILFISIGYQRAEQGRPGLRHHLHLGRHARSARGPAGWAAGASSRPTCWSWPAWRRSPASTCSCCSGPTASASNPTSGWVLLVGVMWIVVMTYICYRGIEISADCSKVLLPIEVVMLLRAVRRGPGQGRHRAPPGRARSTRPGPGSTRSTSATSRRSSPA